MRCEVVVEVMSESNAKSGSFLYTSYDLIPIDFFQPSHMPLGLALSTSVNAGGLKPKPGFFPKTKDASCNASRCQQITPDSTSSLVRSEALESWN